MRPILHIALILVGLMSQHASAQAKASRPNVLIILTDDQGYGDLGCQGNDKIETPNIDRLSTQSVSFSRFYVSPVCSPTRSSLLTGRYTYRTGVVDTFIGRAMMHADEVTLAEVLKGAGYRTGIFGKWHLGDCYPMRAMDQGFEESLVILGGGIGQPSDPPGSSYMDPILFENGVEKKFKGYCTDVYTDATMKFMEAHAREPFFAYLATNAPHTPLEVPEQWVTKYRQKGLDDTTAKIYAMVENIDRNVGRLMAKLEELKISENTIVVYFHDNGPQQKRFTGGLRGLKGTPYEGGIRSPLFVRWPGHFSARRVDDLAAHIDLMPTLLGLCHVPPREGVKMDGIPLAALSLGETVEQPDRRIFLQWHRGDAPVAFQNCAVVGRRFKLVNGKELFDLQADPGESRDIADGNPEMVKQLRKEYEDWFTDVTSAHRFNPAPRIILGAKQNPVTLTRQDWRGEKAGWAADSIGHWDVTIAAAGKYEIKVRFPAARSMAKVNLSVGGVEQVAEVIAGATEHAFSAIELRPGETQVEATITEMGKTVGVHYVDVSKAD